MRAKSSGSKLPAKLRINGYDWSVAVVEALGSDTGEELLGVCRHKKCEIAVVREQASFDSVVFHEVLHATCPGLPEETIREVERGVMAVLRDNPAFARWLADGCA